MLTDRSKPAGATIKIFVVRMDPPKDVQVSPDPVLLVDGDIGDPGGYGSIAGTPQRLHRIVYRMDPRGLPHSEPSMACPEVARASSAGTPSVSVFVSAVVSCRQRLTQQGVQPADFSLSAAAADAVDLRRTLGIQQWTLGTYGSADRISLEVARQDAGHVRALVMDSPEFPGTSPAAWVIPGTNGALRRLFDACRADRMCDRAHRNLPAAWKLTLAKLHEHPVTQSAVDSSTGSTKSIVVDDVAFIRVVRLMLAGNDQGSANIRALPKLITETAQGHVPPIFGALLATDDNMCVGFRSNCRTVKGFSLGAMLSALCPDVSGGGVGSDTFGIGAAYSPDPYTEACRSWPMPAVDAHSIPTDVPILAFVGGYDPMTSNALVRASLRLAKSSWIVPFPNIGHNILGFEECAITIRNGWVDDPTSPPDTSCLSREPPFQFKP